MRRLRALVVATHPLPTLAVTLFTAAAAAAVGVAAGRTVLVALAVLSGQLSVGWSNDWIDRERDRRAGRLDKPIARGDLAAGTVGRAAVLALAACVPLSAALGRLPGVVHLIAVASAWAYNAGLKTTVLSPLPYLVSFGLVPPVLVALVLPGAPLPRWSVPVATALLGVSAHFANTVGDEAADTATAVRGLPQRLGPRRSVLVSAGLLVLAAPVLLLGTAPGPVPLAAAAASAGGGVTACLLVLARRPTTPHVAFRINIASAALLAVAFLTAGSALTAT